MTIVSPFFLPRFPDFSENWRTNPCKSPRYVRIWHITIGWRWQTARNSGSGFSQCHDRLPWRNQTASSQSKICAQPCCVPLTFDSLSVCPSDLRESGSLEQDADIVMFLYREDYYKGADDTPSHITELIVAKHRNGPPGRVTLLFKEDCTKFISLSRRKKEFD